MRNTHNPNHPFLLSHWQKRKCCIPQSYRRHAFRRNNRHNSYKLIHRLSLHVRVQMQQYHILPQASIRLTFSPFLRLFNNPSSSDALHFRLLLPKRQHLIFLKKIYAHLRLSQTVLIRFSSAPPAWPPAICAHSLQTLSAEPSPLPRSAMILSPHFSRIVYSIFIIISVSFIGTEDQGVNRIRRAYTVRTSSSISAQTLYLSAILSPLTPLEKVINKPKMSLSKIHMKTSLANSNFPDFFDLSSAQEACAIAVQQSPSMPLSFLQEELQQASSISAFSLVEARR